ncbi:MAG: hypothetical protein KatS3mg011_1649 [Acidimicrobiia bacterium]|nr:MAG: hypothetical protein KatS3mg011_1649 [Acidimicrobiia bacterium]
MRRILVSFAVAVLAMVPAAMASAQTAEGDVIVVHGVPGLAVDIYVNGDLTFENSEFGDVFGPLALPAGSYEIEIYPTGSDPATTDPALAGSADLPAGAVATIAAYLQEGGSPTLGVFVEDNSPTDAGNARITARHLADFGPVDILANDGAVFEGVTNGQGGSVDVPADTYNVKITAAGDPGTVAFDADLTLAEGTNTIAYAVGSVADETFQVLAATITGLAQPPAGVPTGTGGLVAAPGPLTVAGLSLVGLVALGASVAVVRRNH